MHVMTSPSSQTEDTIPSYLYYVHQPSYRPPTYPQGRSPPRNLVGALTSSTNVNTNQISQTDAGSNQTYPTDVGLGTNIINKRFPRSIISSCRRSSCTGAVLGTSQSEPQPNISNRLQGSNNINQVASTSLARCKYYDQLSPIDIAVPRIVSNLRRDLMNYFQPMPGLSNPEP